MKVSIIGTGYVGLTTGICLAQKGNNVICVDNDQAKVDVLNAGGIPIYEPGLKELLDKNVAEGRLKFSTSIEDAAAFAEVIFISVGTPPLPGGGPDLSYVENVARHIARAINSYKVISEKSTVPVRTGERVRRTIEKYAPPGAEFDIVSNPEFLREGTAVEDTLNPDRIVVGVASKRAEAVMRKLYSNFNAPMLVTDIESAELIKHASNSFLAMKISFVNAVANVCELSGADIGDVTRGMAMDKRIGPHFLRAGLGYGGSCFPKDVEAFAAISKQLGYAFGLLKEVEGINRLQKELFVKKIEQELWVLKGKKVGVLGLAFKPDTDDIREAPALYIVRTLVEKGADVAVYDPKAMEKAKAELPEVRYCNDPYEAARGADCITVLTEWEEFARLDLQRLKGLMSHPTIIDGRNVFDPKAMRTAGFTYRSVGRP
jgi:UDPglucose 6-dehydrogenase